MILDHASRNAGTREEGEPGSQCGSKHAPLRVRTKPVFGHCSAVLAKNRLLIHTGVRRRKYKLGQTKQQPPGGQHIAKHCSFMCLQKTPKCAVRMVRTLSSACRLQHWDPGSPSSRVPAFLLARSKINLLRLADASGARG